jgi:hypothetical protein
VIFAIRVIKDAKEVIIFDRGGLKHRGILVGFDGALESNMVCDRANKKGRD